ncbi:hypothetical protein [Burkholderia pseudomallei]|nr:hypothetical protein [Burkholderia pseudomallei]
MKLEVKDMSCGGCANAITQAIQTADSSARVSVVEAAGFHPAVLAA